MAPLHLVRTASYSLGPGLPLHSKGRRWLTWAIGPCPDPLPRFQSQLSGTAGARAASPAGSQDAAVPSPWRVTTRPAAHTGGHSAHSLPRLFSRAHHRGIREPPTVPWPQDGDCVSEHPASHLVSAPVAVVAGVVGCQAGISLRRRGGLGLILTSSGRTCHGLRPAAKTALLCWHEAVSGGCSAQRCCGWSCRWSSQPLSKTCSWR